MGLADRTIRLTVGTLSAWQLTEPGVLRLPSGRLVRGRGLRSLEPARTQPDFGLYLQGKPPPTMPWSWRWVRWPDMWLPADPVDARNALVELWERAEGERVEVACSAGRGRTGTALACLVIMDGLDPAEAIRFVRQHYNARAVENPWQRRWVRTFR